MRRFYITPRQLAATPVCLSNPEARHIQKVLRLKTGAHICLFDGCGAEYEAVIEHMETHQVALRVLHRLETSLESPLALTVAQGVLKDKKMDGVLRALTELGVTEWRPFFSRYTVPVIDAAKLTQRVIRWNTIAHAALKQCRRNQAPAIRLPCSFEAILHSSQQFDCKIICWEKHAETSWPARSGIGVPSRVLLLLGPEGGFTSDEVAMACQHGFVPVSLGPRTLRAETATIAACAIIQHRFGDLG